MFACAPARTFGTYHGDQKEELFFHVQFERNAEVAWKVVGPGASQVYRIGGVC
jgi:hypothetical protein